MLISDSTPLTRNGTPAKNIANIIKNPLYSEPSRCFNKIPNPKTTTPIKNNIKDAIPKPFLYFFSFLILLIIYCFAHN